MKKILKGLLVAVMALTMTACGSDDKETDKKEAKTLTIGISPDYEPYESLTKENEIVGFDVDMVALFEQYLSEEEGVDYKLEFKQMDFDNIVTQIQGDQVDLGISGFTYDEKRVVEWSNPYLGSSQVAVLPKGSKIQSVKDLEGKKLVAQTGATGEDAAKAIKGADVTGLKNVQDIMNALAANQYDAAIIDLGVAKNYVANADFTMLNESLLDEKNYIIAKKGNTEVIEKINKCIEKFLASEDYDKLCQKYDLSPLEK